MENLDCLKDGLCIETFPWPLLITQPVKKKRLSWDFASMTPWCSSIKHCEMEPGINFIASELSLPDCGSTRGKLFASQTTSQIARLMGPTWGPPGSCQPQMGPMLAPWTLLSEMLSVSHDIGTWFCCVLLYQIPFMVGCISEIRAIIWMPQIAQVLLKQPWRTWIKSVTLASIDQKDPILRV